MDSAASHDQPHIAYFEESETGVPMGYTGWYHSGGKFPINGPQDVFKTGDSSDGGMVRPEIEGPFLVREDALADLHEVCDRQTCQI